MIMAKTTVKVDSDLKARYERLFEDVHGVKPVTSSMIDKTLEKEIEKLEKMKSKKN
jgi:predicted transcriptional regulator